MSKVLFNRCFLVMGQTPFFNIKQTQTSFFEHQTNSNMFIYWWSNSNTWILASNERTLNIEPKRPSLHYLNIYWIDSYINFSNIKRTRTCSSFGDQTRTPYFWLQTIEHQTLNIVQPITNSKKSKGNFPIRWKEQLIFSLLISFYLRLYGQ